MTVSPTLTTLLLTAIFSLSMVSGGSTNPVHHSSLPGYSEPVDVYSGFIEVDAIHEGALFYMFYPSLNDPANDPVAIWINGGPGASSLWGMLVENGPYRVTNDGNLTLNEYGWNAEASVLYIDQPVGTGMSYVKDVAGLVTDEKGVGDAMVTFITSWYQFPEFEALKDNPLFVTGESYAGKYAPTIGLSILDYNEATAEDEWKIPLAGIAIGNAWTDPVEQNAAQIEYAFGLGIIDTPERTAVWAQYSDCMDLLFNPQGHPDPMVVFEVCDDIAGKVYEYGGIQDMFDLRNLHAFEDGADLYLSRDDVRQELQIPEWKQWNDQGDLVEAALNPQVHISSDVKPYLPRLFSSVRTLFYTGDFDMACPVNSVERFLRAVPWEHAAEWRSIHRQFSHLPEDNANTTRRAWVKSVDSLTQMNVHNAGHFVPHNVPEFALSLINRFMANEPLCGDGSVECSYVACPNSCSERGTCIDESGECDCSASPTVPPPSGAEYKGTGCGTVEWSRDAVLELPVEISTSYLAPGEWSMFRLPINILPYTLKVVVERTEDSRYGLPDLYASYGQAPDTHRYFAADLTPNSHHELVLDLVEVIENTTRDIEQSDLFIAVHNRDYREVRYNLILSSQAPPFDPFMLLPMAIIGGIVAGAMLTWSCMPERKDEQLLLAPHDDEQAYLLAGDA